jgi:hypothetical protein
MPIVNKAMTVTNSRDLFPGALEMMILESRRREPAHGYALEQRIQQRSNHLLQVGARTQRVRSIPRCNGCGRRSR